MKKLAAILFALFAGTVCAVAMGQTPELRRSIVSVGMPVPGTNQSATVVGTVIGISNGQATVLTVAHLGHEIRGNAYWVRFASGTAVAATLIGKDDVLDIAVVRCAVTDASCQAMPVASLEEMPRQGDRVEFIGHGGGQLRHFLVAVVGYSTNPRTNAGSNELMADFTSISGDSGGPFVFNGKLVAVQWGYVPTDGKSRGTAATCLAPVLTQWGCPPQGCQVPQYQQPQYRPPVPPSPGTLVPVQPRPVTPPTNTVVKGDRGDAGAAGAKGDKGDKGDQGPAGKDGKPPSREDLVAIIRKEVIAILADSHGSPDYDVIAAEVQSRLDPIYANPDDKTGTKLGGVLPPFTAQVKDGSQLLPGDKGTRQVYLGQKLPIKRSTTGTASPAK